MKTLDCRQLACPAPVLETRKQIQAEPDTAFSVLVGDDIARQNVSRLATTLGYQVSTQPSHGGFSLLLTPAGQTPPESAGTESEQENILIYIASDCMGHGDDELGRLLMHNFLGTLTELNPPPATVLFVNSGVKLTTEGSEVLTTLEKLVATGTDLASCGLCLDYFGLKNKLKVGRTTNMLEVIEQMSRANRIIRP
ncbi:MAG: sulfurtransferase-like selenium metabolism protein YedF [Desulfuromonadaceae bacterium]|jgi:selenium metabolism protein YedF